VDFHYWDLGQQPKGAVIEVRLSGNAANVRLLDRSNYSAFKNGRGHRYVGGHVKRSPVRVQVPHSGHWYVAIDYGGLAGRGRASVQVLPGALPELRQRTLPALDQIGQNAVAILAGEAEVAARDWDVFISHATEDKEEVVRPLAEALQGHGLRVWYDEFELRIGSSLRRSIDEGLANSRFGVVVLSHAFFSKNWPQYELDGLVTREQTGEQVILPLWHKITKAEVIGYSPSLADKLARSTTAFTLEEIAAEIVGVVQAA
jgi:hypothetical protein